MCVCVKNAESFLIDINFKYTHIVCVRTRTQFYILHVKVLRADLWTNEEDILYTQVFPPLTILKCYDSSYNVKD